ncbi:helix-turn-helix domain-containing protein [Piscibacillus sp. B03]|uniref:helix-turn-helix domain-containing protein n=1 Tax=Piscibacillus sp. B03 TaxID=3457430 RepID=UPI003FCC3C96
MLDFDNIQAEDDVERLMLLRKRLRLRQYELAKRIGVTPEHLARIESYQATLTKQLKERIKLVVEQEQQGLEDDISV